MADRSDVDPELQAVADEAMAQMRAGHFAPREIEVWWERRRDGELTPDYLGRVLEEAGCDGMAKNARAAHYDDFFAPAAVADGLETLRLVRDLYRERDAAEGERADRINVIADAAKNGEFDATKQESDRWAASEGGQSVMRELVKDKVPKVGRNDPCPCGSGRKYKRCHGTA